MNDQTRTNLDIPEKPIFIEGDYPLTELPLFVYDERSVAISEELQWLLDPTGEDEDMQERD